MIKKLYYFILILCIINFNTVKADTFKETDYLTGEYITVVENGIKKHFTMRLMKNNKDVISYCLEPFVVINGAGPYTKYRETGDHPTLTKEQRRRLALIGQFGYGFPNRTDIKWYAITQYLIWTYLTDENTVYFTDTPNGTKINKYSEEIQQILNDVNEFDTTLDIFKTYKINYGDDLVIENIPNSYVRDMATSNPVKYELNNGTLKIPNITKSGMITLRKDYDLYDRQVEFHYSNTDQDMMIPGNVFTYIYTITFTLVNGKILINLNSIDDAYSIERSLENSCYDIVNKAGTVYDSVCFDENNKTYESIILPLDEYHIIPKSTGVGYIEDSNTYKIKIDQNNSYKSQDITLQLIKNKIEIIKKSCKNNECIEEPDAEFEILDKNNNVVSKIITDSNGETSYTLGYGTYKIKQVKGLSEHTLIDEYEEHIVDTTSKHQKELYNQYIEPNLPDIDDTISNEENPPFTGIKIEHGKISFIPIATILITIISIIKLKNNKDYSKE